MGILPMTVLWAIYSGTFTWRIGIDYSSDFLAGIW